MHPVRIISLAAFLGLVACGTPEYRAERSHCEAEWMLKIPPVYTQETVIRHRSEERPSGAMDCKTEGNKTICMPKMTRVSVPYTAVETVDIRKAQRDPQIESCAAKACQRKFGNSKCEV